MSSKYSRWERYPLGPNFCYNSGFVNIELRLESHHVDGAGVLLGLAASEGLSDQLNTGELEPLVRQTLLVGLAPLENNPHIVVPVQIDQVGNVPWLRFLSSPQCYMVSFLVIPNSSLVHQCHNALVHQCNNAFVHQCHGFRIMFLVIRYVH